ncbi:MAG: MBL fold metallo-hydrolase [Nannocystaceae bacterium]|nr:MBL fold metallo-hydrolase [Nannocystaceae bacterium]
MTLLVVSILVLIIDGWQAFGRAAQGERAARMQASAQWSQGAFVNPQPMHNDSWLAFTEMFDASPDGSPDSPLPLIDIDPQMFDTPPPTGLRVTWFGHSTMLLEIDGKRVLTDPVWGERTAPWSWLGPQRWYTPRLALEDLPSLDAVVISHDHYDHLDYPTIAAMRTWDTVFVTPLGVGAHLEYWGVPPENIIELDWWQSHKLGELEIVCASARHASGRTGLDNQATLWAGYALIGPQHRVYFSGDTGMFPGLQEIGDRLGPFDLTMLEAGAYDQAWPDWHLGPEQAVAAHQLLRGKVYMPVHWGLFNLALHGWTEPLERTAVAAAAAKIEVYVPRPGESFEPERVPEFERWWPQLPWRTASQYPIAASQLDSLR